MVGLVTLVLMSVIGAEAGAADPSAIINGVDQKVLGFFSMTPRGVRPARVRVEVAERLSKGGVRPEAFWISETPKPYWVAQKRETGSSSTSTMWADSRSCEDLATVLSTLSDPGLRTDGPLTSTDALLYSIEMQAPNRPEPLAIKTKGGAQSASGRWVEGALRQLSTCWSDTAPSAD